MAAITQNGGILPADDYLAIARSRLPDKYEGPVQLINLLRFHDTAQYPEGSAPTQNPISGKEAYLEHYVPAFRKIAPADDGVKATFLAFDVVDLISTTSPSGKTNTKWDAVGIVEYPSFDYFAEKMENAEYKEHARPHRLAALKDFQWLFAVNVAPKS